VESECDPSMNVYVSHRRDAIGPQPPHFPPSATGYYINHSPLSRSPSGSRSYGQWPSDLALCKELFFVYLLGFFYFYLLIKNPIVLRGYTPKLHNTTRREERRRGNKYILLLLEPHKSYLPGLLRRQLGRPGFPDLCRMRSPVLP
jgi:hypothetical protein